MAHRNNKLTIWYKYVKSKKELIEEILLYSVKKKYEYVQMACQMANKLEGLKLSTHV